MTPIRSLRDEASRSRPVTRVGGLSRMSGRPPRYAIRTELRFAP